MKLIATDPEMIERLEIDLVEKVQAAYTTAGVASFVYGVFSLDDLENKLESELCSNVGVGVGYLQCIPTAVATDAKANLNVDSRTSAVKTLDFQFLILLAVPTGNDCMERYNAGKLLTVMRRGIMGSVISNDPSSRTWAFVEEKPNMTESTETMLYYSQVWRVAIPFQGNV